MSEEGTTDPKANGEDAGESRDARRLAVAMEAAVEAVDRVNAGSKGSGDSEAAIPVAAAEPEPEPEPGPEPDLAARIEALEDELEDWKGRAYRTTADLENVRKRFNREREDLRKFGIESLLKDLLPVADNMDRAVTHISDDEEGPLAEGIRMVLQQLTALLDKHGARPFEAMGEPFDPQYHEAMSQLDRDDVEPGTVIEVYQRGWMLHDRLARPAMVIVARAPAGNDA